MLRRLARAIWLEAYDELLSRGQIQYMLERMYAPETISGELDAGMIWEIIRSGDEEIGFLSYGAGQGGAIKLAKIYLAREARGSHVAAAALNRVIRHAQEAGADSVYLTVNKRNHRAVRAYEKAGFVREDAVVTDIGGGYVMDDYIMRYTL